VKKGKNTLILIISLILLSSCSKTEDGVGDLEGLREKEFGQYIVEGDWTEKETQPGEVYVYTDPIMELTNEVSVSYVEMPYKKSDHKVFRDDKLLYYQTSIKRDLWDGIKDEVIVEEYISETQDTVYLFTFMLQGKIVERNYYIVGEKRVLSVLESLAPQVDEAWKEEMNETSEKMAKKIVESFQWNE